MLKNHKNYLIYLDICLFSALAIGLVISKFLVNFGMFALILRVIFSDRNIIKENFKRNKNLILILSLFFILNIIGMIWTDNIDYGLRDLNKKIGFLLIPIGIGLISPLDRRVIRFSYIFYIIAILFGVGWGSINYIIEDNPNTRNLIPYVSHIRFSLNLCLGIISLTYIIYKKKFIHIERGLSISIIGIFTGYLFISQSFTGILIFFSIIIIYIPYHIYKHNNSWITYLILILYLSIISYSSFWIINEYNYYFTPNKFYSLSPKKTTNEGNKFEDIFHDKSIENGNYVYHYFCMEEIAREWEKRTGINVFSRVETKNGEGAYLEFLVRYMNSIHPIKDAERFKLLSDEDIENIKNGIVNKVYTEKFGLRPRLYKLFFQINSYREYNTVKNFSEIQRLELWKNSISIIKENYLIGVGTGDIADKFESKLMERKSELYGSKLRSHNQYLNVGICFGLLGFIVFLFWLIYPGIKQRLFSNLIYSGFFFIISVSMIAEDTLDNLAGIMFFIIIQSLFAFNFKTIKEFFD